MRTNLDVIIPFTAAFVLGLCYWLMERDNERAYEQRVSLMEICMASGGTVRRCYDGH